MLKALLAHALSVSQVLSDYDADIAAQEMIVEQFIAARQDASQLMR